MFDTAMKGECQNVMKLKKTSKKRRKIHSKAPISRVRLATI